MPHTSSVDLDLDQLYRESEEEYFRTLTMENIMESPTQAHQRKITLESFDVIRESRPDIQCFNELLVQYPLHVMPEEGENEEESEILIGKVTPDNMVVVHDEPLTFTSGSFRMTTQPVRPTLMLEYVSASNWRKDYVDNVERYSQHLQAPYYLRFDADRDNLTLFHLEEDQYVTVVANSAGRYSIPELELEVKIQDDWVRFWFRGKLVPLPGDLVREVNEERTARQNEERARRKAEKDLKEQERARQKAEKDLKEQEQARQKAEKDLKEQGQARQKAEKDLKDSEKRANDLEVELARLREQLAKAQERPE